MIWHECDCRRTREQTRTRARIIFIILESKGTNGGAEVTLNPDDWHPELDDYVSLDH